MGTAVAISSSTGQIWAWIRAFSSELFPCLNSPTTRMWRAGSERRRRVITSRLARSGRLYAFAALVVTSSRASAWGGTGRLIHRGDVMPKARGPGDESPGPRNSRFRAMRRSCPQLRSSHGLRRPSRPRACARGGCLRRRHPPSAPKFPGSGLRTPRSCGRFPPASPR